MSQFTEETSDMLNLEHSLIWFWNLETSHNGSEITRKFWNVMLEKDETDKQDRSCDVLHWVKDERNILHAINVGRLTGLVTSGLGNAF